MHTLNSKHTYTSMTHVISLWNKLSHSNVITDPQTRKMEILTNSTITYKLITVVCTAVCL